MGLLTGFDQPTLQPLQSSLGLTAQHWTLQTDLLLGPQMAERLWDVAGETSTSPNTLIQLAWAMLLSAYSGDSDVLFGATWSGRFGTIEDASQIVGPLINTLPVRVNLNGAGTVRVLLTGLRRQHLAMRPFQRAALSKIKAGSEFAGSAHLFQTLVIFEYERFYTQLQRWDDRWRNQRVRSRSQTGYPLVLAAWFEDGELVLELEYDAGLYAVESVASLLADYARLLRGLCEHLDASLFAVPMLDPELCATLTTVEAQRELTPELPVAIERIVLQARTNPSAAAVKELDGREVTYADLERRVRRLSGVLRRNGAGPGALVVVWLPRSIDWVVALLAVHAAGGAFVPLHPQDPQQRVAFTLRDANVTRLRVSRQTRGRLERGHVIELDIDDPAGEEGQDEPTEWVFPDPASPAYVIYTSGSTGEPKGVCVSQGALANHLRANTEQFALVPQDRVPQFAALAFDAALEELIPTLATGATLVLRNDEIVNSARDFLDSVAAENITVLNLPTMFWHQLVQAQHLKWPSWLRLVVVGGERVSPEAHRRFREADTGHIRWMNAYATTETTITSTCYDDEEGDHGANGIPIGRLLAGVSHFVLDEHLRPVPAGAAGQV
jgi:amino acid adenylation domain-containing protein